tara:strand:+ start:321 stop:554 length:234 start_codon:yes stop_codon:yes gene_type:complete
MAEEKAKDRYRSKGEMGPGPTLARSCGKGQKWDMKKKRCINWAAKSRPVGRLIDETRRERDKKSGKASYDRFMMKKK